MTVAPSEPTPGTPRQAALTALLLAALTFAAFGWALNYGFIDYDDNAYVYNNPIVKQGLTPGGIKWAFDGVHAYNWHPLTWLSHMLDCDVFGVAHPGGHHATSVLLHAASVVLLFFVLRKMLGSLWPAALAAALFGLHPLRVESVAWVAERKDVLSGFFFVLTLGAYAFYTETKSRGRYVLMALLYTASLLSKPTAVTLPFLLLLLDYWPLRRAERWPKLVLEKVPLLVIAAISSIITLFAQREAIQSLEHISLLERLANAAVATKIYLRQFILPVDLCAFYPFPHHGNGVLTVIVAVLLLAGITWFVIDQRKRRPWIMVGWFWFLIALLPVIGIVQVGNQAHADRYTYIPEIGLCLALAWSFSLVLTRAQGWIGTGCMAVLLVFLTARQVTFWQDSKAVWQRCLACTTENDAAHYGMGNYYSNEKDYDLAIAEYQQAIEFRPSYVEAEHNIGYCYYAKGDFKQALYYYRNAILMQPAYADPYFGIAGIALKTGDFAEAINNFHLALQHGMDTTELHGSLGTALFQSGKRDDAMTQFRTALAMDPSDPEAIFNIGNALEQMGKVDDSIPYLMRAVQLKPDLAQAHFALGLAYLDKKRDAEAMAEMKECLRYEPDDLAVANRLAWELAMNGQAGLRNGALAVQMGEQIVKATQQHNPIYMHTLAAAYAEVGDFASARKWDGKARDLAASAHRDDITQKLDVEMRAYAQKKTLHD